MKHTMSESVYASSNRGEAFVRNGRLVKAVTLALVLGFSGVVGGMVQAAGGELDISGKGGIAVMMSDDKAHATGEKAVAVGEGTQATKSYTTAVGEEAHATGEAGTAIGAETSATGT